MIPNEEPQDDFKNTEISVVTGIIIGIILIGGLGAFLYAIFTQMFI